MSVCVMDLSHSKVDLDYAQFMDNRTLLCIMLNSCASFSNFNFDVQSAIWEVFRDSGAFQLLADLLQVK